MQRSFTSSFEQNLHAFVKRKIPCELLTLYYPRGVSSEFDAWLERTVNKKEFLVSLRSLYDSRFRILPAPVLAILGETHFLRSTRPEPLKRDKRQRRADGKVIDSALKLIEIYPALQIAFCSNGLLSQKWVKNAEQTGTVRHYLESLKEAIAMIVQKKPSDIEMRFCAQTLEDFFRHVTGQPRHESIGSLLVHAFDWPRGKGEGDQLRLAALKRAEGPSINARRSTLREAIDLQNGDYQFWREKSVLVQSWREDPQGKASAKAMKRRAQFIKRIADEESPPRLSETATSMPVDACSRGPS